MLREQVLVLANNGVLGGREHGDQVISAQLSQRHQDWQSTNQLGDEAEFGDVVRGDAFQERAFILGGLFAFGSAEANAGLAHAAANDVFESNERSAAHKQDVRGVDLDVVLFRVLASTLRGDVGGGAFQHFQQGLLHPFARDIPGNRDVLGGPANLVDFVDVDDATLCGFHIPVGGLQKPKQQVLDIFTDVSGFGQGGGVTNGKGHIEHAGQ